MSGKGPVAELLLILGGETRPTNLLARLALGSALREIKDGQIATLVVVQKSAYSVFL